MNEFILPWRDEASDEASAAVPDGEASIQVGLLRCVCAGSSKVPFQISVEKSRWFDNLWYIFYSYIYTLFFSLFVPFLASFHCMASLRRCAPVDVI